MWYDAKMRGRLCAVIEQLSQIVSEDVLEELLVRQRLVDHIGYIHQFFYMLHGSFVTGLNTAIRLAVASLFP